MTTLNRCDEHHRPRSDNAGVDASLRRRYAMLVLLSAIFCAVSAATAASGPAIDSTSFIGRDQQGLAEAFGAPETKDEPSGGLKSYRYVWTRVTSANGTIKYDGRGNPPSKAQTDSDLVSHCVREFSIHSSGLILRALDTGDCATPPPPSDPSAVRARETLSMTSPAQRYDGPDARDRLALDLSYYFFVYDDQAGFDRYLDALSRHDATLNDGSSALTGVMGKLFETFLGHEEWVRYEERIAQWRKTDPRSTGAALLEASFWNAYVWYARGTGMASTVSEEGAELFRERIERALKELARSEEFAGTSPLWHELRLQLMLYNGSSRTEMEAAMEKSLARFPDYLPLRFTMLSALQPHWGGSPEAMDAFIQRQLAEAAVAERPVLYARLYWSMSGLLSGDMSISTSSNVEWARMAGGFRALLAQYPVSFWNRQNFAALACAANDGDTYREIRPTIEGFFHPAAWAPPFNLETCDHHFLTKL